ncbi:MAG: polysaccharide deacetylase family protein [Clostridiaceae bacterium]
MFVFFSVGYNGNLSLIEDIGIGKGRYDVYINGRSETHSSWEAQRAYNKEEKTTYLTFDDGPSNNTIKILDILDKYNIKATFFVVGKNIEWYPEILKEIVKRGHMIGIHCYNHDYSEIYSSTEAYIDDFYKTYNLIKEVAGIEPYIFRFPGGSVNTYNKKTRKDIAEEMERRGFVFYDWNSSCEDAVKGAVSESCVKSVINTSISQHNILLCHDTKKVTLLNLEIYIKELRAKGYKYFHTLEGVPPIHFLNNY